MISCELTEEMARSLCTWRYPWRYNGAPLLPPWEQIMEKGGALVDPARRSLEYTAYRSDGIFIGITKLTLHEAYVTLGIAVHPDWCGKGYGAKMLAYALCLAGERHPGLPVVLEVTPDNERAIRLYRRTGFVTAGEREDPQLGPLLIMRYDKACG